MTRPISPSEAKEQKVLPEFVIEAINELIRENMTDCGYFDILQKDIISRVKTKTDMDFDDRWLHFIAVYEAWGWSISYDRPGYTETYSAYYRFTVKR